MLVVFISYLWVLFILCVGDCIVVLYILRVLLNRFLMVWYKVVLEVMLWKDKVMFIGYWRDGKNYVKDEL